MLFKLQKWTVRFDRNPGIIYDFPSNLELEGPISQLHKRFTDEQIKLLFQSYYQGRVSRADLQEMIGIGKSRFFVLLKAYRSDPDHFTIAYQRKTHAKISPAVKTEIEKALLQEKAVVEDLDLPISGYNYSAMKDRLKEKGIQVSVTTIINRAKKLDCHKPRKKRKTHDREVLKSSIGALIQHDVSTHKWPPSGQLGSFSPRGVGSVFL